MTDYNSNYFDANRLVAAISKHTVGGSLELVGSLKPVYIKHDPFEWGITSIRQKQGMSPKKFGITHDFTVGREVNFLTEAGFSKIATNDGYFVLQKGFEGGRPYEAMQLRVLVPVKSHERAAYPGIDLKMVELTDVNGKPSFYRWDHELVGSRKSYLPHGWSRMADLDVLDTADFLLTTYEYNRARSVPKKPHEGLVERMLKSFRK